MPSYLPDPTEYILAKRKKLGDRPGGFEPLNINWARRPWAPGPQDDEFIPVTPGDPDFQINQYLADAQVPSAHAESRRYDAQQTAQQALEQFGSVLDPETRKRIEGIAEAGFEEEKSSPFLNFLNLIDTPGELIRLGIADIFGVDEKQGYEIDPGDYLNSFLQRDDLVRERLGVEAVGENQFLMEGGRLLTQAGWDNSQTSNADAFEGFARGTVGFLLDVFSDPLTYVSFGTVGLGKKVAMEAAQSGLARAGREALDAVARDTVSELTDSASREIAERVLRRVDDEVLKFDSGFQRVLHRDAATKRILLQEEDALALTARSPIREGMSLPRGSVMEGVVSDAHRLISDKQFKTLAQEMPWFMSSRNVPNLAKGGLQLGTPFGRKRFNLLRVPGTETNRLATKLLGREVVTNKVFPKLPQNVQKMFQYLGRRTGTEKAVFLQAQAGNLWSARASAQIAEAFAGPILRPEAIATLRHIRQPVLDALGQEEGDRAIVRLLSGDHTVLEEVGEHRAALELAVFGDEAQGIDGLRTVFDTFLDAAQKVGLDVARARNYVPMVMNPKFGKVLDDIAEAEMAIPFGAATSTESKVGMEILSRYADQSGDLTRAGQVADKSTSRHVHENRASSYFASGVGGEKVVGDIDALMLNELVDPNFSGMFRHGPLDANRYIRAALDDLAKADSRWAKVGDAFDDAFETDVGEMMNKYLTSMGEAIQYRALVSELRRNGLLVPEQAWIDISQTLASVKGRLSDPMISWLEALRDPAAAVGRATRKVETKIGGRRVSVPAVVAANPKYGAATQKLNKVFSRVDRHGREMSAAVEQRYNSLIRVDVPDDVARRIALGDADVEYGQAILQVQEAALEEVQNMRTAVLEMVSRNMLGQDEALLAARQEAAKILRGAQDTIDEMDKQFARALGQPEPSTSQTWDLLSPSTKAPPGYGNPMSYLADMAEQTMIRSTGTVQEMIQATARSRSLQGASRAELSQEAVRDLGDRLTVTNVTLADIADFATPGTAARIAYEANQRLLDAGFAGVGSLTREMAEAAESLVEAERFYFMAVDNGEDVTEALSFVRQARADLEEVAGPMAQSDELVGDIVDTLAQTVDDINDEVLMGQAWGEVWATAIHKQGLGSRKEFAEMTADAVEEGFPKLTQKELTERNAKGVSRQISAIVRESWAGSVTADADFITARANQLMQTAGAGRFQRVLQAMKANDRDVILSHPEEVRQVLAIIQDKTGRHVFDPTRIAFRNGTIVYEPEQVAFVTLTDVMDDVVRIADMPNITDMERLRIVNDAWRADPTSIEAASPKLGAYFRQVDSQGGLPIDLETYEYLRSFVADLGDAVAELGTAPTSLDNMARILDEIPKVYNGKSPKNLANLWAAGKEAIEGQVPANVYRQLADIVGRAEALGVMKPSRFVEDWRGLVGEADEAFDSFTRDVARLRHQGLATGEKWASAVAEDMVSFAVSLERVMSYGDDLRPGVRPGFHNMELPGGQFNDDFDELRAAASKARKRLNEARGNTQLATFLPPLPDGRKSVDAWLSFTDKEMKGWKPITVSAETRGKVKATSVGVHAEALDGLVGDAGTMLMLEHMAVGAAAVISPLGVRLASEALRETTKWWKAAATVARPTFVPRNLLGGVLNGLIIGVGPRHYAFVNRNALRFRNLLNGGATPAEALAALPKAAQPYFEGLWESGLLFKSFSHTLENLRTPATMAERINPLSRKNIVFEAGGRFMETSEDFLRAAAFVRWYDPNNPASRDFATEMALTVHFDYDSLTKLESQIRRVAPFFVWTRRNLPLQMRAMIEQPGYALRLLHFRENLAHELGNTWVDDQGFAESPYMSGLALGTPILFNEDSPYWQRLMLDPQVPLRDVEELGRAFAEGPGGVSEWLLRSLSPVYSTPIDSLQEPYDTVAPTGLREIMLGLDRMLPGEQLRRSGDEVIVPSTAANLFRTATPFLGEWARVAGLAPSGTPSRAGINQEDGITPDERLRSSALQLGRAFGATLQVPEDTRSAAAQAEQAIQDIERNLYRTGAGFESEEDMYLFLKTLLEREGIDVSDLGLTP